VGINVLYRLALVAVISGGLTPAHGGLATEVLPNLFPGRWGEFAFGMLAAELYTTGQVRRWAKKLRWGILGLVPLGLAISGDPISHLVFGLVFFIVLCLVLADDNVVARVFSWTPAVVLGTMSYSIYLMHTPVLEIINGVLKRLGASPNVVLYGMIGLLPLVLFVSWLLFVTVERRSLSPAMLEAVPGGALLSPKFLRRGGADRRWPRASASVAPRRPVEPVAADAVAADAVAADAVAADAVEAVAVAGLAHGSPLPERGSPR
jgi:peptidoglycan/LPS O-acetylase OafA/YrhL